MTPREIAIQNGEPYYNSGKPCRNGHTMARYTKSAVCVQCNRDRSKKNADKIRHRAFQAGMGLSFCKIAVHPDDLEQLEGFAKALKLDRGID